MVRMRRMTSSPEADSPSRSSSFRISAVSGMALAERSKTPPPAEMSDAS